MSKNNSDVQDESEEFLYVPTKPDEMYSCWSTNGKSRRAAIKLRRIDNFDARGMKGIYGRYDVSSIGSGPGRQGITFCFAMWLARDGRVVARFSSRSKDIYTQSMEVVGMKSGSIPDDVSGWENEELVPQILRDAYADWQLNELQDADLW